MGHCIGDLLTIGWVVVKMEIVMFWVFATVCKKTEMEDSSKIHYHSIGPRTEG
jgi:hypothetical protein